MDQSGVNQSSHLDSGTTSLERQFNEMKLLNEALMAMVKKVYCPNQVIEEMKSVGFSLSVTRSVQQDQQIILLNLDLNLLLKALRSILDCLSRRGKNSRNLKIMHHQNGLNIILPAADCGLLENSVIATFAIEILTKMGAVVESDKENLSVSIQRHQ